MFQTLNDELLDLQARSLGRPQELLAMFPIDCCCCCCSSCWPYPLCIIGM